MRPMQATTSLVTLVPIFYIETDLAAPRKRLIAIDTRHPERANWKELIPEQDDVMHFIVMVNNQFVVTYYARCPSPDENL